MPSDEPFLDLLDVDDRAMMEAASHPLRVRAGDALFLEGDRSDRVILVETGLVRVSALSPSGAELLVAFRGPGDVIGDQAALDGAPHGQTVRAVTDLAARSIPAAAFIGLLNERPCISLALHRIHVGRLRQADEHRLEQATLDVTGRIARRLVRLYDTTGETELGISHQELASWVGASREAVTKALGNLRRRGLVETTRGRIVLGDPAGLRAFASV